MKKLLTAKLSLILLLSLFGSKANAWQDDGGSRDSQCCESSCYECGCNPLYCGAWDLQVQGGVNPILWRQRGYVSTVACSAPTGGPVFQLFQIPKFRSIFRIPWIVGGQVGYAWSDNTRLYVEFNYSQALAKGTPSALLVEGTLLPAGSSFNFLNTSKYKIFDAYVGARYYWDRWCDRVSFFFGGKVGLTHNKKVASDFQAVVAPAAAVSILTAQEFFRSNTVVSGGANVGFDVCFCGNWSFVVTGEIVASCGPRSVEPFAIPTNTSGFTGTNLFIGNIQTELRFPVTAAIRYSF